MPYQFREDISLADVAFEASGKTIAEMFESAALATTNTMVKDLATVQPKKTRKFTLQNAELDRLLHDFLQELIFEKDANLLLFSSYQISVQKTSSGYSLNATCKGESLDMNKHELLVDVKAVSWHLFKVGQEEGQWVACVILDV